MPRLAHPDLDAIIDATPGQARVLAREGWAEADTDRPSGNLPEGDDPTGGDADDPEE